MVKTRWYQSIAFKTALVALGTALVVVPLLLFLQAHLTERARDKAVADYVVDSLETTPSEASTCAELQAEHRPRHRRGSGRGRGGRGGPGDEPRLVFFDADFRSVLRIPFELPPSIRRSFSDGADWGSATVQAPRGPLRIIAVRLPDTLNCSYVATVRREPDAGTRQRFLLGASIITALAAAFAAFLPGFWLARRVKTMTNRVRAARESGTSDGPFVEGGDELAELSETIRTSWQQLEERGAELEESRAALERHIAQTSHDLRTPLTVLQQRLHRLREALEEGEASRGLDAAVADISYISSLLANLNVQPRLDRAAREGMDRVVVNLGDMISRVAARYEPIASLRDVTLNCAVPEEEVHIEADVNLLERMLSNLTENAVKYVPEGGHVALVLESVGEQVTCTIRDSGAGVPEDVWRGAVNSLKSKMNREVRSGVGLGTVLQIVEIHGWQVTHRTGDGESSEVCVTLPLANASS